jgi:hypothetical protein
MQAAGPDESRIERQPRQAKPPEPLARKAYDRAVEKLFRLGDADHDGLVTLPEFTATIDARKTRAIAARFAEIDADRNQQVSFAEFSAWQRRMGSAALSDGATAAAGTEGLVAEDIALDAGDGREDQDIARVLVPLNAVLLANANSDYDSGTSLAELLAYEGKRFDTLDVNKDGWLTVDEMRSLRPGEGGSPPPR